MTNTTSDTDKSDLRNLHFATLRQKYHVEPDHRNSLDKLLYLILRKADLGIEVTDVEFQWLEDNQLFETIKLIQLQQYQSTEKNRLEAEFQELQTQYRIPKERNISLSSPLYAILLKLETGQIEESLFRLDFEYLKSMELFETVDLIQDIKMFQKLKVNYKATQNISQLPEEPLYSILKKLNDNEQLTEEEGDWLLDQDFTKTLEIYFAQEKEREEQHKFSELKSKYKLESFPENSISSPLYSILNKIEADQELEDRDLNWLKEKELHQLIEIDTKRKLNKLFSNLKEGYKATQSKESDTNSPLFSILYNLEINRIHIRKPHSLSENIQLKIQNEEFLIQEKDIDYLLEQGLNETAKIAQIMHFYLLQKKYNMVGKLDTDPFYEIMLKLEREERLDPKQVIQLIEEDRLSRHGKIAIAHYTLEAKFYEQEYKRTGNLWNLPTASSNWRKADQPDKALQATDKVNFNKVREPDLKSALLVTRGAAFRDLHNLDEAENCATEAINCQPDTHQPYTLIGAICYDKGEYSEGDMWFEMATERGANDTDDEIERIVRMTKDKEKRREVAEYLLSKDSQRYAWATSYLK